MSKPTVCRFCNIHLGQTNLGPIDTPIMENDEFFMMASIGALIEGWSLVVPKQHVLSLRDFYKKTEFSDFLQTSVDRVESKYGPVVLFEHGANHCGSITGCGTDHAHLHIVPATFSLSRLIEVAGLSTWQQIRASEIAENADGGEYLFFSNTPHQTDPVGYFMKVAIPSSQFFRRVIASLLGMDGVADYKRFPHYERSIRTMEQLVVTQ